MDLRCPSCRTEVLIVDGQLLPEYTCHVCGREFAVTTDTESAFLSFADDAGNPIRKNVLRHATLIGSEDGCNIRLVNPAVAATHCVLTLESNGICVRDLRSQTGTRVNGSLVEVRTLSDGDRLSVGPFEFTLDTNLLSQTARARTANYESDLSLAAPAPDDESDAEASGGVGDSQTFIQLECRGVAETVSKNVYRPTTLIGSGEACNIRLRSPSIAVAHCLLTIEPEGLRVRDLRTTLGTLLNGERVEMEWLSDGDELKVGEFSFQVKTNLKPSGGAHILAGSDMDPNEFE